MAIKKGDRIMVAYEGRLENGKVFDSSAMQHSFLTFTVGAGELIKGFDEAVVGHEVGEKVTITIPPESAYGGHSKDKLKKFPRSQFQAGDSKEEIAAGKVIAIHLPNGQSIPVKVVALDDEEITLDLNHPLAGQTLIFDIQIVDFVKGDDADTEEETTDNTEKKSKKAKK